jgi:hypothetical protein
MDEVHRINPRDLSFLETRDWFNSLSAKRKAIELMSENSEYSNTMSCVVTN